MTDEELLGDDARHLDEIIAIGEALGAPEGSTGREILEIARELVRRVGAMDSLLRQHLPKCGGCGAIATRTYIHTVGQRCYACDNEGCITEHFCAQCHQVAHDPGEPCPFCGSTEYTPRVEANLTNLPFANVRRRTF